MATGATVGQAYLKMLLGKARSRCFNEVTVKNQHFLADGDGRITGTA